MIKEAKNYNEYKTIISQNKYVVVQYSNDKVISDVSKDILKNLTKKYPDIKFVNVDLTLPDNNWIFQEQKKIYFIPFYQFLKCGQQVYFQKFFKNQQDLEQKVSDLTTQYSLIQKC